MKIPQTNNDIQFIIIDLFCGAGGTTTGFEMALHNGNKIAQVVACVNHDPIAIKSHWANHPEVEHFEEDITTLYGHYETGVLFKSPQFIRLINLVNLYRAFYPNAKVILWASLECTNFSKAKGGLPRDADSRTLADHLHPYIIWLDPDYVQIENVVEFMSWGPLDDKGKPVSKKNGQDWVRWRHSICELGYLDQWKEMNSADYGALTSRNRLFGCFSKKDLPIVWPQPTHSKNPAQTSIVNPLKKWEPVKKALDFSDEGNSVFNRKNPLSTKTMQRIFMGCVKHIAGGKKHFLSRYYSGHPEHRNHTTDEPAGVVTTNNRLSLIKACFIDQRNGGNPESRNLSIDQPARTLTATGGNQQLVQAHFIQKYYSNGGQHNSIDEPASTITTKDRLSKISATFIDQQFGNPESNQSVEAPLGSITTVPKSNLVHAHYLLNPSWFGNSGSVDDPCHVVIARQDKAPLYLISCIEGIVSAPVYDVDCEWTVKLKEFMVLYGICDIKMRMLKVFELKVIQGFPESYILLGSKKDQKKAIGNAVHSYIPNKWILAFSTKLFPICLN